MPELPEVEVLVRHLRPQLQGQKISSVVVHRERVLAGTTVRKFVQTLTGTTFASLSRRGKYLLFELVAPNRAKSFTLVGHLGMTGRMYLLPAKAPLPKHAPVVFGLGDQKFVFEDTRYFGRLTLDTGAVEKLGPEPLDGEFTPEIFEQALKRSSQPIKVKLLDQSVVAGVGNIYASEALFLAGISPRIASRKLKKPQILLLWKAIRQVLKAAIRGGSTVSLDYTGVGERDGLVYFGSQLGESKTYEERLHVYDRAGKACPNCGSEIKRLVQAARSTFYCPQCQGRAKTKSQGRATMSPSRRENLKNERRLV